MTKGIQQLAESLGIQDYEFLSLSYGTVINKLNRLPLHEFRKFYDLVTTPVQIEEDGEIKMKSLKEAALHSQEDTRRVVEFIESNYNVLLEVEKRLEESFFKRMNQQAPDVVSQEREKYQAKLASFCIEDIHALVQKRIFN